jgi:L-asparaginase II
METRSEAPILVEATRGPLVESRHRGHVALVDAEGGVVLRFGDIETPIMPRSAVKPLQALPLVESGAADAFGLGDAEIALACASHRGEPAHVARVTSWLRRVGLGIDDLECGAHLPGNEAAARALIRHDQTPSAVHNNCSGKHAGFLTTARHLGEPTRSYIAQAHPVQRRVAAVLGEMTDSDAPGAAYGIDGCGIPTIALPLRAWAMGLARLADPGRLGPARRAAATRILASMAGEPFMVSGSNSMTTLLMEAVGARLVVKPGAEGVYAAILRERGLGLMIKMEDGAARGADLALAALLQRLGLLDEAAQEKLARFLDPPLANHAGRIVGRLQPAAALARLEITLSAFGR